MRPKGDASQSPKLLLGEMDCADLSVGLTAVKNETVVIFDKANAWRDFLH